MRKNPPPKGRKAKARQREIKDVLRTTAKSIEAIEKKLGLELIKNADFEPQSMRPIHNYIDGIGTLIGSLPIEESKKSILSRQSGHFQEILFGIVGTAYTRSIPQTRFKNMGFILTEKALKIFERNLQALERISKLPKAERQILAKKPIFHNVDSLLQISREQVKMARRGLQSGYEFTPISPEVLEVIAEIAIEDMRIMHGREAMPLIELHEKSLEKTK